MTLGYFSLRVYSIDSKEASSMVLKHKKTLEELKYVKESLPQQEVDLEKAYQQIPNLQLK